VSKCLTKGSRLIATFLGIGLLALSLVSVADGSSTRSLNVPEYQRLHLRGNALVRVTQVASGEQLATAVGDARYLKALEYDGGDKTLFIDAGSDHSADKIVIHLHVAELTDIVSEGLGEIFVDGLTSTNLTVEGRGAGRFDFHRLQVNDLVVVGEGNTEFQLHGVAENQFIELSGAGRYHANKLASETSQVSVRGSGVVELNVRQLLDVNLFGAANIRYSGHPVVRQQVYGSGRIRSVR